MLLEFWKRKPKKSSHEIFNFFHRTESSVFTFLCDIFLKEDKFSCRHFAIAMTEFNT